MTQSSKVASLASPREVFERLVYGVADSKWDEVLELYAEDAVLEHPLARPPTPPRIEGQEQIRKHFAAAADTSGGRLDAQPHNVVIYETLDPEVIVGEFEYHTQIDGRLFTAPNIFVMRVRDGRIVSSRNYLDHQAFTEAAAS